MSAHEDAKEEEDGPDSWESELLEEDKIEYTDINLDYKAEAIHELLHFTEIKEGEAVSQLAQGYEGAEIPTPATNSKVLA